MDDIAHASGYTGPDTADLATPVAAGTRSTSDRLGKVGAVVPVVHDPAKDHIHLNLTLRDPDVVGELVRVLDEHGPEAARDHALVALRVGMIALRQARPTVDETRLRNAGTELVESLRHRVDEHQKWLRERLESQVQSGIETVLSKFLDPKTGAFTSKADALTKLQGELPAMLEEQLRKTLTPILSGDNSEVARAIASQIGHNSDFVKRFDPQQKDSVVATITAQVKSVLDEQNKSFQQQFSFDNEGSALKKLVTNVERISAELKQDFSMDNSSGALKRLNDSLAGALELTRKQISQHLTLEQDGSSLKLLHDTLKAQLTELADKQTKAVEETRKQQTEFFEKVGETLARMETRRAERAASTGKGLDYEQALFHRIQELAGPGELVENCGNTTGIVKNSKKGDVLLVMDRNVVDQQGIRSQVVFEAKNEAGWTPLKATKELDEAIENRQAEVGVFVLDPAMAAGAWPDPISRQEHQILVLWDPEDPASDPILEAAVHLARFMAETLASSDTTPELAVNWEDLDSAIANLNKQIARFEKIQKWAETIQERSSDISEEARKMQAQMVREISKLSDQLTLLRQGAADLTLRNPD